MKKFITASIVLALVVFSVCFVAFRNTFYNLNTLTEKLNACYNGIESIVNEQNLENKCSLIDENMLLNEYCITVNGNARIDITFETNATKTQKGYGRFSLSYTIYDIGDDNNFDVELFTDFVNSISGKTVTTDFVTEFLTAPEDKYSCKKYGLSGDGYAVKKMHSLNFWEDWIIGYELTYDNQATLWFYGYIK